MIEIKRIQTTDINYPYMEELMQTAFPIHERRDIATQRLYADTVRSFHNHIITKDETPIGLITYWDFEHFLYIEHFAIDPSLRNKGYGKDVLEIIKEGNKKPIVLEAEEPTDEMSIRRISFYQRAGFVMHEYPYLQPPYRKGDQWFPLKLMTFGNIDMQKMYIHIKEHIYKKVYNV